MRAWLWLGALGAGVALASPGLAQFNVGGGSGGAGGRAGAGSWPINTYMRPDEIARADAAIERAGSGEIGGTVQWSAPSGARGTITVADEIFRPGEPVCREFAVVASLPARTETNWQAQPGGGPFGGRSVEVQTQSAPAGNYRFTWTACRVGASWTPR
jgi:hypothetical protein